MQHFRLALADGGGKIPGIAVDHFPHGAAAVGRGQPFERGGRHALQKGRRQNRFVAVTGIGVGAGTLGGNIVCTAKCAAGNNNPLKNRYSKNLNNK